MIKRARKSLWNYRSSMYLRERHLARMLSGTADKEINGWVFAFCLPVCIDSTKLTLQSSRSHIRSPDLTDLTPRPIHGCLETSTTSECVDYLSHRLASGLPEHRANTTKGEHPLSLSTEDNCWTSAID